MPIKRTIYLVLSLIVTAAVFVYLFSHVTFSEIVELLKNSDRRGIWMFVVLSLAMNVFRTWRYRLVILLSGFRVDRIALFLIVVIRNLFADLLPVRLGSLIYVYLVTNRLNIPLAAASSSFVLAIVFDLIAVGPLIALAALLAGSLGGPSPLFLALGGGAIFAISIGILAYLPQFVGLANQVVSRCWFLRDRGRAKLKLGLNELQREIRLATQLGVYYRLFTLSLLVRLTKYGALYVFLFALVKPQGFGFTELPIAKAFLGLVSAELAASLPISGIGGFGAYEGIWALVFEVLGFTKKFASVTAVAHHLFTQVYGYTTGAIALLILMLPFFSATQTLDSYQSESAKVFVLRIVGVSAFVLGTLCVIYISR